MTCKVLIVSHSYIEPENQKNLQALANHVCVSALVPTRAPVLLFDDYQYVASESTKQLIYPRLALQVSSGQYVLFSARLAKRGFHPSILLVEYNPWSLMFLQVWLCRSVFFTKAKLVCFVKKNTYSEATGFRGRFKSRIAEFLVARTDHFIAGSEMAASLLRRRFKLDAQKVTVEHHLGVDTDLFRPRSSPSDPMDRNATQILVGYCGRFDPDKGVLDLVDSVRDARAETGADIILALLGRGSLTPALESLSAKEGWIRLKPAVSHTNVVSFLQNLDIFVLPSKALPDHEEHDAHALLEALACGLPCIATDVGINGDILAPGHGILVPRGDSRSLGQALARLVNDKLERERLGLTARELALRRFSLEAIAERKAGILKGLSTA